eukprot:scaffold25842_cov198-Amphora_coffeaeformis.AAC.18
MSTPPPPPPPPPNRGGNKRGNPDEDNRGTSQRRRASADQIQPLDVILGRESLNAWQLGSIKMVQSIDERLDEYTNTTSNQAKSQIIQEIYAAAKGGGRFLARDDQGDGYVSLDEHEAKEKISHMIRYRRNRKRKLMKKAKAPPSRIVPSSPHPGAMEGGGGTTVFAGAAYTHPSFPSNFTDNTSSQATVPFWVATGGTFAPVSTTDGTRSRTNQGTSSSTSSSFQQGGGGGGDGYSSYGHSPHTITRPPSDTDTRSNQSSEQDELFSDADLRSVLRGDYLLRQVLPQSRGVLVTLVKLAMLASVRDYVIVKRTTSFSSIDWEKPAEKSSSYNSA